MAQRFGILLDKGTPGKGNDGVTIEYGFLTKMSSQDEMGRSDERRRNSGMVELKSSRTGGGLAGYRGYESF